MNNYEWLEIDRIEKIKSIVNQYGEENFYLSFSGGKDSTILHYLVDLALPENKIPRVFINTGIEYNDIVKYVKDLAEKDDRFVILKPTKSIKKVLDEYGYPFKSKQHSHILNVYQNNKNIIDINNTDLANAPKGAKSVIKYVNGIRENKEKEIYKMSNFSCPNVLKYQFTKDFDIKISDKCCLKLKKEPVAKWAKENNKSIVMTGMRKEEGGNRSNLNCIVTDKENNVIKFHPLSVVNTEFEDWFLARHDISLCKLYYSPFNFTRTGCKGCPFALELQEQLDKMVEFLPAEERQCEMIWQPVYQEYRKLNYRLNKSGNIKERQLTIYDFSEEERL